MIDGGGHERGMRSGTLNVPGIVGLGKACELAQKEMGAEAERLIGVKRAVEEPVYSHRLRKSRSMAMRCSACRAT